MDKFFIFTMGPTGSGKNSLHKKVIGYLGKEYNKDIEEKSFVNLSLDDYIVKNPYYKAGVDEFLQLNNYNPKSKSKSRSNSRSKSRSKSTSKSRSKSRSNSSSNSDKYINIFSEPSQETINYFNKLYFETRENVDCISGEICERKKCTSNSDIKKKYQICKSLILDLMVDAIHQDQNIVYESTANKTSKWFFNNIFKELIENNYNIIFCYSIVEFCELIRRNKSRAISQFKKYLIENESAPRLPNIQETEFKKEIESIINIFKNKILKLQKKQNVHIIIFDNNTRDNVVLFDSLIDSNDTAIKSINGFNIENECSDENESKSKTLKNRKSEGKNITIKNT